MIDTGVTTGSQSRHFHFRNSISGEKREKRILGRSARFGGTDLDVLKYLKKPKTGTSQTDGKNQRRERVKKVSLIF